MTYQLILNPGYIPNDGEIIDSFLVHRDDGSIYEYARIQTEYGINMSLAGSASLGHTSSEQLRDLIVTPDGTFHIYSGTFDPALQSFNWQPYSNQNNRQTYSGWSTINNVSYGGIDYYQNYIFVTDMKTSGSDEDKAQGIVRFSQTEEPAIRFAEEGNFIDLTVGLDNLIYGLESYGKIKVYDPKTLKLVRSFTLEDTYNDYRGIAVNQQGEIFSAAWNGNIYYFNPEGNIVDVNKANQSGIIDLNTNNFYDINISPDGKELIASDRIGLIALLKIKDQYLELEDVFPTGGKGAFVSFGARNRIVKNNSLPKVFIANSEVVESDFESSWMNFTISLSDVTDETVEVNVSSYSPLSSDNPPAPYSSANNSDFFANTETISFAPGETEKTFSVEIYGDLRLETSEYIYAEIESVLSDNAEIENGLGIGVIIDNETEKPKVSLSDAEAIEGNALEFTISLERPIDEYFTVNAFTTNNYYGYDATEGEDYWSINESITFAPGETSKTFTVDTIADSLVEGDERVLARISSNSPDVAIYDSFGKGIIPDNDVFIGEVGYVEDLNHFEKTIQFQNQYENPVVIVSPLTRNGGDPAIARITDIQGDSFSVFVQEPTLLKKRAHTGSHTLENFSYIVMEAGTWTMADGTIIEVGTTEVDTYTRQANWSRLALESDFEQPIVISSVQTHNNQEFIRLRQRNGNESGIDLALEKEEALLKTDYANETVGYIAVNSAPDQVLGGGISYVAGNTGKTINHEWQQLNSAYNYPYLFASTNSYYGGDSVGLRYQMGSIMLEEDTSKDYEVAHARENVAYLGFDNLGTITAEI